MQPIHRADLTVCSPLLPTVAAPRIKPATVQHLHGDTNPDATVLAITHTEP
jgi:hypothetical protein